MLRAHAIKVLCFARQMKQRTGLHRLHLGSWHPRWTFQAMEDTAKRRCTLPELRHPERAGGGMLLSHACPTQAVCETAMAGSTGEPEHQAAAHNQTETLHWHLART
jgi:hypothetical protein